MRRAITLVSCIWALLLCPRALEASWDTVVFRDDFDSPESGPLDPNAWVINHPGECWWGLGRTHFPCPEPGRRPEHFPRVEDGVCVIEHHLYNPYHEDPPYTTFLGGEIHTVQEFEPTQAYRFEAKLRWNEQPPYVAYPSGVVNSFFPYQTGDPDNDEIDFEFVSKQVLDRETYPNGDPVLTNPWNQGREKPRYVAPEGLALTDWNIFRIYWCPDRRRVVWTWVKPTGDEVWLRTEVVPSAVPDESMALYFNFWAANADWDDAYDPNLQPVSDLADDEVIAYEIDYVEVRVGGGHDLDLDGIPEACDNCPNLRNADQEDLDYNGIGDACQCGDVNGDGYTNVSDALKIAKGQVLSDGPHHAKCDCNGDTFCNVVDALIIARGRQGSAPHDQHCPAYQGSAAP